MKEGQKLIADMLEKTGKENWSWQDLYEYIDDGYFDIDDSVGNGMTRSHRIDGWFSKAQLEAILIAISNEEGAMRG